jgi:hypothetical protein
MSKIRVVLLGFLRRLGKDVDVHIRDARGRASSGTCVFRPRR